MTLAGVSMMPGAAVVVTMSVPLMAVVVTMPTLMIGVMADVGLTDGAMTTTAVEPMTMALVGLMMATAVLT